MAYADLAAVQVAGQGVDQGPRQRRGHRHGDRAGTGDGVVQLAHGDHPRDDVEFLGLDLLATRHPVGLGWGDQAQLGRMWPLRRGLGGGRGQPHGHRARRAQGLQARQQRPIAVDLRLGFGAAQAQGLGAHEDGGIAGIEQGHRQPAQSRDVQFVDRPPGGQHTAVAARRIEKVEHHLGGRKGHAVEAKIALLLHLAIGHGNVGEDALAQIGLPDAHPGQAVARGLDQALADGEGAHGGAEIATVARPVDHRYLDGRGAEQIVDVTVRAAGGRDHHHLAGAGGGPAQAVDLLAVGIGAADHPQQQRIARRTGRRQVAGMKEHALAGTATHVDGGDTQLRHQRSPSGA